MTSKTWTAGTTVDSVWLQDVDNATYKAANGITGAVTRTALARGADRVSAKDHGAIGDGVTDDTAAIQAAIDSLSSNGGLIYFPEGQYLISSTLNITTNGIALCGPNGTAIWNGVATVYKAGARIIKKNTMTTEAIKLNGGLGFVMEDIVVLGNSGNTGDGIYLQDGQSARFHNVAISGIGGNGLRIGAKTGQTGNVNGFQIHNLTSQYNGGKGVYIYDESAAGGPNANAGTCVGLNVAGNTGDGLHIENGQFNTFTGLLSQQNTGYGVKLVGTASISLYVTFVGGDVESNTAGNWSIGADAKHITYIGAATAAPSLDPGTAFSSIISGGTSLMRAIKFSSTGATLDTCESTTFTPSVNNLTVVNGTGGATYSGTYDVIGKIVFWTFKITTTGTCTTASTAGSTFVVAPYGTMRVSSTLTAMNETSGASLGVGECYVTSGRLLLPSWTAQTGNIIVSGTYVI